MNIMERILPIGQQEWEQVFTEHDAVWPGRDLESIRRRCNRLHRKKTPTGDPNVPPEVRQAKRVNHRIGLLHQPPDGLIKKSWPSQLWLVPAFESLRLLFKTA